MRRLLACGLVAVLVLAACGGGDNGDASGSPTTDAKFNDADVMFAQMMIAHHEAAIEMADLALDPRAQASTAVKDLASRSTQTLVPDITKMDGWLRTWDKPESAGHTGMNEMSGEEMDRLGQATGAEFDKLWLEGMIDHHEGAIDMANTVKADGTAREVRAFAEDTIDSHQAELDEMRNLL